MLNWDGAIYKRAMTTGDRRPNGLHPLIPILQNQATDNPLEGQYFLRQRYTNAPRPDADL